MARHFLQFGQSFHQLKLVQMFLVTPIIPFVQGYTVIPDISGNINLAMELFVPP
jgi:hypothetical protein